MENNKQETNSSPVHRQLKHTDRKPAETALISEPVLAREWLKPEEDRAWDYL